MQPIFDDKKIPSEDKNFVSLSPSLNLPLYIYFIVISQSKLQLCVVSV